MFNISLVGYLILGVLSIVISTMLFLYSRKRTESFETFKSVLISIRGRKINTFDDLCYLKRDVNQLINNQGDNAYDFCLKEEWDSKLKYLIINFLFGIVLMFVILIANNLYLKLILSIVAIAIYLILLYIVRKRERSASIYVNKEIDCFLNDEFNIFSYTTGTNRYL